MFAAAPLLFVALAVQAAPPPARLSVTVTDAAGGPLPGGAVTVRPHRGNVLWTGEPAASATIGEDGRAALTVPADPAATSWRVAAEAPGFAPFGLKTPLAAGEETRVALELGPAVRPALAVTGPDGRPLAGARLREFGVAPAGGNPGGAGAFWRRAARDEWTGEAGGFRAEPSGPDGRLTLPPVPAGGEVLAHIEHPDFAPAEIRFAADADAAGPVEVRLEPGVRVTVRVRPDAAAPPVEPTGAVKLWLNHETPLSPSWLIYQPLALGPADADGVRSGSVTVAPGAYGLLRLFHPAARFTPHAFDLELEPGADRTFEFVATGVRPVTGRAFTADGEPAAGVSVFVTYPNRPAGAATGWLPPVPDDADDADERHWVHHVHFHPVTDAGGRYAATAPVGPVRVTANRYADGKLVGRAETAADVPPPAGGETYEFAAAMLAPPADAAGPVSGVVRRADGSPAAGAFVRLRGPLRYGHDYALTDDAGRFTLNPTRVPRAADGGPSAPIFACDPLAAVSATASVDLSDPAARAGVTLALAPHDPAGPHDLPPDDGPPRRAGGPGSDGGLAPPLKVAAALNYDGATEWDRLRGRVVLLDFWATWCGGCRLTFPLLDDVRRVYGDRAEVLTVHDAGTPEDVVRRFIEEHGVTLPVLLDAPGGPTTAAYDAAGKPTYVLVGRDGRALRTGASDPPLRPYLFESVRAAVLAGETAARP